MIQSELDEMKTANDNFRAFVLSESFLEKFDGKLKLDDLTSKFQASLVTLTEEVETLKPLPTGMPVQQPQIPGQQQTTLDQVPLPHMSTSGLSYPRVILVSAAFVITGVLAFARVIPPLWFMTVLAVGFCFLFFDQIKEIAAFFNEEKVEETTAANLKEQWIIENFQWVRERYTSAYMLIFVQTNSKRTLPRWALPNTQEEIYNTKMRLKVTLPTEILERTDRIYESCRKNGWERKKFLVNALAVIASAAAPNKAAQ